MFRSEFLQVIFAWILSPVTLFHRFTDFCATCSSLKSSQLFLHQQDKRPDILIPKLYLQLPAIRGCLALSVFLLLNTGSELQSCYAPLQKTLAFPLLGCGGSCCCKWGLNVGVLYVQRGFGNVSLRANGDFLFICRHFFNCFRIFVQFPAFLPLPTLMAGVCTTSCWVTQSHTTSFKPVWITHKQNSSVRVSVLLVCVTRWQTYTPSELNK